MNSVVLNFDYESKTVAIFPQDLPDSLVTLSVRRNVSRPPYWIVILVPDSLGSDKTKKNTDPQSMDYLNELPTGA